MCGKEYSGGKKKEKKEVIYWKSDSEYKAISKGEVEKSLVW